MGLDISFSAAEEEVKKVDIERYIHNARNSSEDTGKIKFRSACLDQEQNGS